MSENMVSDANTDTGLVYIYGFLNVCYIEKQITKVLLIQASLFDFCSVLYIYISFFLGEKSDEEDVIVGLNFLTYQKKIN